MKHWIKNLIIFLPAFFGQEIRTVSDLKWLLLGGISFGFAASFVYIINDIYDADKDKLHPIKKRRPIASGAITKKQACIAGGIVLAVGGVLNELISRGKDGSAIQLYFVLGIYILSNIGYSVFRFKDRPLLDILIVSSGYLLRLFYGSILSGTKVSIWLFLTVLMISLYISIEKRKKEFLLNTSYRDVFKLYSETYLSMCAMLTLISGVIFFVLWTIEIGGGRMNGYFPYIASTIGIIMALEYMYEVSKSDTGDPIIIILHSWVLLVLAGLFVMSFMVDII